MKSFDTLDSNLIFSPPVEGSISIKVKSSKVLVHPVYYVITGFPIMIHKKLNQASDRDEFTICINISPELKSSTKIVVYYIDHSGEVIYDSISLGFKRNLTNFVSSQNVSFNDNFKLFSYSVARFNAFGSCTRSGSENQP